LDAVFSAAETTGTALEVNGSLPRLDMSVEALRRARSRTFPLVLTSDAHHSDELERVRYATLQAERAWVDPARVANTWSTERLVAWARGKSAHA
jgi:histidinol phosphatase-like PHP family hydrolase